VAKVVILQHRLLHYRTNLFAQLRQVCAERGIDLHLVHGQASPRESAKKDEGTLPWAHKVRNRYWQVGGRDILWQPFPGSLGDADLVVVMQENRILSNYPWLLSRWWSARKVAYWGHGKNLQSDVPAGLREKWKAFLLTRVDWWFAYTEMTVDILCQAGYPAHRITCLNNAIDTENFKTDLASWSADDIVAEKSRLGIAPNAPVGIFCGSLYPDKRLDLLVAAADRVRKAAPQFSLLVMGDGPSMPQLQDAAESRAWLYPMGVRQRREKALYFRMADVMLNPGAVGLHIVDSFCGGQVMVTTRNARHGPEVAYLSDGKNGVYGGDTPETYSRAVLALLQNPARLQAMKAAALADGECYTMQNMVHRFAEGIESALRAPTDRRGPVTAGSRA
jgi:glycosyltransferase involved in cell wall biosynthesis